MNRNNNNLNFSSFMEEIDRYMRMMDWKEDDQTIEQLCIDISKNWNFIKNNANDLYARPKIAALAKRIKVEFSEHEKAQEVANLISCYVNAFLFNVGDIVQHIFSYLTPLDTNLYKPTSGLRNVGLVSKSFLMISKEVKNQWVQDELVSLKIYGLETADKAVEYIIANNLKKINLTDFRDFNETHLRKIAGSNIQSLRINCESIKEWSMMDSLTRIIPKDATDDDLTAIAKACPKLTTIDLNGTGVTDVGVTELAKTCPKLTTIDLTGTGVTDVGLTELAKACPNLMSIDLPGTWVTDIGVKELAKTCPNLTTIDLTGTGVTDVGLTELAKTCPNLTQINICGTRVTDVGIRKLAKKCPNLMHISLYNTEVTGVGLEKLEKVWPNLTFIDLCSTNVTDVGLTAIVKACPNLTTIRLRDTEVTNVGVTAIAKACPNLTTIDLINSWVTYFHVAELKKAYASLEILYY